MSVIILYDPTHASHGVELARWQLIAAVVGVGLGTLFLVPATVHAKVRSPHQVKPTSESAKGGNPNVDVAACRSALSPRVQPKKLSTRAGGIWARPRRSSTLHGGAHFPKENVSYTWLVVQHVEQLRFLAS